ncbi:MAG: hypothetical protein WCR27_07245 [Eubacteriales bacterium]
MELKTILGVTSFSYSIENSRLFGVVEFNETGNGISLEKKP